MRMRARVPITMPATTPERVLGEVLGMDVSFKPLSMDLTNGSVMLDRLKGETYSEGVGAVVLRCLSGRGYGRRTGTTYEELGLTVGVEGEVKTEGLE